MSGKREITIIVLAAVYAFLNYKLVSEGLWLIAVGTVNKLHIATPLVLYSGFKPLLTLAAALFALVSLLRPKISYAGVPIYIAQLAFTGSVQEGYLAIVLVSLLTSHLYSYYVGGSPAKLKLGRPRIRVKQYTAIALVSALAVAAPVIVGLQYKQIVPLILSHSEGDVRVFLGTLSNTLLFKLILVAFAFYLVWKAVDAVTSIASLAIAPRASVLALYDAKVEDEKARENLVLFKGRQNGFLREGLVLLFSFIFSPVLFPIMRGLVQTLGLTGNTATVVYLALSYAVGWILMRLSVAALFDPLPLAALLKPRRASNYIMLALVLSTAIVAIAYLQGMNPILLVESALTGKPMQPDPLAGMLGLDKLPSILQSYLETLYKGADALVKYLWGG